MMANIFFSLSGVVALILVVAGVFLYFRRRWHQLTPPKSKILHVSPLDMKHKFVVLGYLDTEYAMVLGPTSFLVDKRPLSAEQNSFSTHLNKK